MKELDNFLDKKLGEVEISIDLQNISKSDLLVSFDFNSVCRCAQIDSNSTWA